TPYIVLDRRADLQLDLGEAFRDSLTGQPRQLFVGVAEPAWGRGVRGVSALQQPRDSLRPAWFGFAQDLQRLLRGERVAQPPEVHLPDELLRRHLAEQSPHRFAHAFGRQIPSGIDDRADGHVHHTLFRAEPPQLRVVYQAAREAAEICADL